MKKHLLATILKYLSLAGFTLTALFSLGCLLATILAFFDQLPSWAYASLEVPVKLSNIDQMYDLSSLELLYDQASLEIEGAQLELKSTSAHQDQFWLYLFGSVYIAIYALFLWLLYRILSSIADRQSFDIRNFNRIRNLGIMVIIYALLMPMLGRLMAFFMVGQDWPDLDNIGPIGLHVSWDFTELFFGLLLIVLAEVFRQGYHLQLLEEQTV